MGKRKLNENGIPEEHSTHNGETAHVGRFEDFQLDPRLMQAIAREEYKIPTSVQIKTIPLALEGRDILARARTGSGKTAAYVLPILQSILKRKSQRLDKPKKTSALMLVPTRELASQITKVIARFATFCSKDIEAVDITLQTSEQSQTALVVSQPDIIIATPSRAAKHLNAGSLEGAHLTHIVVDEADLVLSYEYGDDFETIVKLVPQGLQCFLASATLNTDVDTLRGLLCRDPVIVDLEDDEKEAAASLNQYVVNCAEDEKFLLLFALVKLKLIRGKCIVFVADTDRCYRVKIFLEQFGIKSCVLNSELPVNCRVHVVEEFNKGIYDIIIATDEHDMLAEKEGKRKQRRARINSEEDSGASTLKKSAESSEASSTNDTNETSKENSRTNSRSSSMARARTDPDYGISRGIDFQAVACVLNFDLPANSKSYTHRIGRTARAGRTGIALSFVIPESQYRKHKPTSHPSTAHDEDTIAKITASQAEKGQSVQPYHFDMKKLEGFRYRVGSVLKAVTPGVIRQARTRELRQEMLKSEKLKRHLAENPEDLRYLRHDTELRPVKVQPHLKHVPDYLMPKGVGSGKDAAAAIVGSVGGLGSGDLGASNRNRDGHKLRRGRERHGGRMGKGKASGHRKVDPLKTFNARHK